MGRLLPRLLLLCMTCITIYGNPATAASDPTLKITSKLKELVKLDSIISSSVEKSSDFIMSSTKGKNEKPIFHLPQQHSFGTGNYFLYPVIFKTAISQFRNFKLIERLRSQNQSFVVVDEGQFISLTHDDRKKSDTIRKATSLAEKVFPNGMPSLFTDLSYEQLEFLELFGSLRTAYFLGLIENIVADGSGQRSLSVACQKINFLEDPSSKCGIEALALREAKAIMMAKASLKTEKIDFALINYGNLHKFPMIVSASADQPIEKIRIDEVFTAIDKQIPAQDFYDVMEYSDELRDVFQSYADEFLWAH